MKNVPSFWLIISALTSCYLVGCSPKATKGQVFIVTRSAENIKLGLVDVLLFDEQTVSDFLQKKKPAVEKEVGLRAEGLRRAETWQQEAQRALEQFQRTNEAFQPTFLEQKAQFSTLKQEIWDLEHGPLNLRLAKIRQLEALQAQLRQSHNANDLDAAAEQVKKALDLQKEFDAIDLQEKENAPKIKKKEAQYAELDKQITAVSTSSEKKVTELSERVTLCNADCKKAKTAVMQFPTLDFYLSDPLPAPSMKTTTDADGKFEVKLPRKGRFAVFARASRSSESKTENYAWFFWLPSASDETPLMLSNNNLVFAEYAGNVLPVKPKVTE